MRLAARTFLVILIALIAWSVIAGLSLRDTRNEVHVLQHRSPATLSASEINSDVADLTLQISQLQARLAALEHAKPAQPEIIDNTQQLAALTTTLDDVRTELNEFCQAVAFNYDLGDFRCTIV